MSKTDKTQPHKVAAADPHNRRFMIVASIDRFSYPFWKKLTSCHRSNCCYGDWKKDKRRKARTVKRKELITWHQTRFIDLMSEL